MIKDKIIKNVEKSLIKYEFKNCYKIPICLFTKHTYGNDYYLIIKYHKINKRYTSNYTVTYDTIKYHWNVNRPKSDVSFNDLNNILELLENNRNNSIWGFDIKDYNNKIIDSFTKKMLEVKIKNI